MCLGGNNPGMDTNRKMHKDGTSEEISKMEFSYGVDRPEDVADLCEKYGEAEKAEGDVRNVKNCISQRKM